MPTRPRRGTGQFVFHVMNRAIQGLVIFQENRDFTSFLQIVSTAAERHAVRILAYSIMPNHWHLVVWPTTDAGLSAFMQSVSASHAKRWRHFQGTTGRGAVYQGRFKAVAVQRDGHFIRLCLYVERNALRAGLVTRAEDWPWSSASPLAVCEGRPRLAEWPVAKPADWVQSLNLPEPPETLEQIRRCTRRAMPIGNAVWSAIAVRDLKSWRIGLRAPGRPRGGLRSSHPRTGCL